MSTETNERLGRIEQMTKQLAATQPLGGLINEDTVLSFTGLSYTTLYRLRKDGKITAKILSRKRFYKVDDILALMEPDDIVPAEPPPGKK